MTMPSLFKFIYILALFLAVTGCFGNRLSGGEISGNVTWAGQVKIQGDVVLAKGSRLTILPGTEVVFYPAGNNDRFVTHPHFPGSELIVLGQIIAEGSPEQPIVFRYVDETAPPGSWGGVNLMQNLDSSFENVVFRQADSAIHSQESRVYIEQSLFENNLVAIRFHSSEILIENNLIRDNGTGIRFHFGKPVICKNNIINNDKGVFVTSYPRDYLIENNTIMANGRNVVLGEEVPDNVLMQRNFWGTTDPDEIKLTFFDGQVESYLGKVIFKPLRSEPDPSSGLHWKQ